MRKVGSIENMTELEKRQMKTIDDLQEKIRLMEFDKAKDSQKIRDLQLLLSRKRESVGNAIRELEVMKKEENFLGINAVLLALKTIAREVEDE